MKLKNPFFLLIFRKRFEYEKGVLAAELRRGNKDTLNEDLRTVNLGIAEDMKTCKLVSRHGRQVYSLRTVSSIYS